MTIQEEWLQESYQERPRYTDGPDDEPCYVISVVARMLGVHQQTLRYYERAGLIEPSRSGGNIRLYSQRDVGHLRRIKTLINDLGVNLAGVEVVLRMSERMEWMRQVMHQVVGEVERLRAATDRAEELSQGGFDEGQAPPSPIH